MDSEMTIKDFMESYEISKGRRVEIKGKIASGLDCGAFTFIDTSGSANVKALSKFAGQIVPGKFVKLINPELDEEDKNSFKLTDKSLVVPTRRIKELSEAQSKGFEVKDGPTLEMIGKLDPEQVRLKK